MSTHNICFHGEIRGYLHISGDMQESKDSSGRQFRQVRCAHWQTDPSLHSETSVNLIRIKSCELKPHDQSSAGRKQ